MLSAITSRHLSQEGTNKAQMSYEHLVKYLPEPTDWFTSTVKYEGDCRVELSSPEGWLTGHGTCSYTECGEGKIIIDIDDWGKIEEVNEDKDFILTWLLNGIKPFQILGGYNFAIRSSKNTISKLNIITESGIYSVKEVLFYNWHLIPNEGKYVLEIIPSQAEFTAVNTKLDNKQYWVLPLLNFVSDSGTYSLGNHILRQRYIPDSTVDFLNSQADEKEKAWVKHGLIARSYLIPFTYHNASAFIEKLPSYSEKETILKESNCGTELTQVMVGEVSDDELASIDLLSVLGVATGNEVGASWIEYRDKNGELVSRNHSNLGIPKYLGGRSSVHGLVHREGLGELLSSSSECSHFGNSQFRIVMLNLARGAISSRDISEILYSICVAYDELANYLSVTENIEALANQLTSTNKDKVKQILQKAQKEIKTIQSSENDATQIELLRQISEKTISQPLSKSSKFTDRLRALIELPEVELLDFHVMETQFSESDFRNWLYKINYFRNRTMHHASYHLPSKDIRQITQHLHDILVRIILKMLNYEGHYAPSMTAPNDREPIDWVGKSTTAQELGY